MIVVTVLRFEAAVAFKDDTGTRGTPAVINKESSEEDEGSEDPLVAGLMVGEVTGKAAG